MITADPLLLFLAAMLIDMYAGDWVGRDNWPWHPSEILENRIGWVESKLNRPARGTRTLVVRGALTTVIGIGLAVAVGRLIHVLTVQVPLFWIIELTLILSLVDLRRPWRNAIALGDALERDGLAGGRVALPVLSPRDPIHADAYEVARLGVEALASRVF
jgi:adenosylcobinamide-phosphate synthase